MKTVKQVFKFTKRERLLIFLQLEDAPRWKQNIGITGVFVFIGLLLLFGSLLGGLAQGDPSGNNIPLF